MKKIYDFTKGDRIVRIKPAKSLGPMITFSGQAIDRGGDRSYMGEELIYVGIANAQIYLKRNDEDKDFIDLEVDLWDEGWDYFVDPNKLLTDFDTTTIDKTTLKNRLQKALDDEEYELAEQLRKKLEGL